jgi:hypothetical protein
MNAQVIAIAVVAVVIVLCTLALTLQMKRLGANLNALVMRPPADRGSKERDKRDELAQLKQELQRGFDTLRSQIGNIPAETQRRIASAPVPVSAPSRDISMRPVRFAAPEFDDYEEPAKAEDVVRALVMLANRTLQNATTVDAFRASAPTAVNGVSAFPNSSADGKPIAFVVEYRGAFFGVPNVVKPARLPNDWFNRADFGVNDEIRRIELLPKLRRRGGEYEVEQPGVFAR